MDEGDVEDGLVVIEGVCLAFACEIIPAAELMPPRKALSGSALVVLCPSALVACNMAKAAGRSRFRTIVADWKQVMVLSQIRIESEVEFVNSAAHASLGVK